MHTLRSYLATLVAFVLIDLAWIWIVLLPFYREQLGSLMQSSPALAATAVFYLGYVAGIVYLAVVPAIVAGSMKVALLRGAVLGALAYGTYTVSNYALFEPWSLPLLMSDIAWGTFLTAACAGCGYRAGT